MIKRSGMIFVLLVFVLSLFSGNAIASEGMSSSKTPEKEKSTTPVEYDGIFYRDACDNVPKVIEIKIISRIDKLNIGPGGKLNKHFNIYYSEALKEKGILKAPAKMHKFKDKIKLSKKPHTPFNAHPNYISINMKRGQKIKWICQFPFTVYYGKNSILTTDMLGWQLPGQIITCLKGKKNKNLWYETPNAWIVNNALTGSHKYYISVYIPDEEIIIIDDPETIVPPPGH